jgi:putative two-component system response regulator
LASYATALGAHLGLDEDQQSALYRGGFLHDVGKIGVPDAILLKAGPLTPDEMEVIRGHTIVGDTICKELRTLDDVRPIVRHHHERLDGRGYPDGLIGASVPLLAQIISVVDAYDAMTTDRPYKRAGSRDEAIRALRRETAEGARRADFVEAFAELSSSGLQPLTQPRPLERWRF